MAYLESPGFMYLEAVLLVAIGVLAATLLLLRHPEWHVAFLLLLVVWAFRRACRAYYFAVDVVEQYIDGKYKFAGLVDFAR